MKYVELPRTIPLGDDYAAGGCLIGGVHGPKGLKSLCPENYTVEDLECAYEVYLYFCKLLEIEPRAFCKVI